MKKYDITKRKRYCKKFTVYILDLSNTVILYDVNFHKITWLGFVKDLPLVYLHRKIVSIFSYDINTPNELGTTVYIK